jgi:SUN family beta-glucosidase
MKSIVQFTLAASIAAGVVAQPREHQHQHLHRHAKKHSPAEIEKREPAQYTVYETGATTTVYQLEGSIIPESEAKKGIADKVYVVVGESTPSPTKAPVTTTSTAAGAQFFESKASAEPSATPSPSNTNQGGTGLTAKFPSGEVPCSTFPSAYGPIAASHVNHGGWTGLQFVPNYTPADSAISYIVGGVAGDVCTKNAFCSYACPPGYQKTQWPKAQGATLQSIGGLYCNANGMLELSRPEYPTLCEEGAGGVWIQNDLDAESNVCRTDYPGDESMTIALTASPGGKYPLTNPYSPNYYIWNGNPTTAQYYLNKKGYTVKDACVWNSARDPTGAGNWSPVNVGVGKNADGITFLSIFPNKPTSSALLDYNVEIIGDVNAPCALVNGVYTGGGNGCTVSDDEYPQ